MPTIDLGVAESIIKVLMGALGAIVLFMYRDDRTKLSLLIKELADYKVHVAESYVKNEDLERIYKKLDDIDRHLRNGKHADEE
jgi:hypothetical protein